MLPSRRSPCVPPRVGGLHCGDSPNFTGEAVPEVVPSTSGGLHYGCVIVICCPCRSRVVPPLVGGLHCGGFMKRLPL